MKTLKVMALAAFVYCSQAINATVTTTDIEALKAEAQAAKLYQEQGMTNDARELITNIRKHINQKLDDPSITDDQVNDLTDIETQIMDVEMRLGTSL